MNARIVGLRMFVAAATTACSPTPIDAVESIEDATPPPGDAGAAMAEASLPEADAATEAGVPAGLVAHWSFDDRMGALARDDSGNGYHGHLVGGQWVEEGRFGGALRLNRGDYVAVNGFQNASPDWTVSAWFRHAPGDNLGPWSALVSNEIFFQGGWLLYSESHAREPNFFFEYGIADGDGRSTSGCCAPRQPGVWYHLTAVVSDRSLTLYLGSESIDTSTMTSALLPGDPTLYIGRWSQSLVDVDSPGYFVGIIDDVSIFSRALTADEVARLDREPTTTPR